MNIWMKRMGCLLLAAMLLWTSVPTQALAVESYDEEAAAELMATTETYKYYEYELVAESYIRLNKLTLTNEERKNVLSVTIPSEIDGHPVKEIGGYLFQNCPNLHQVTIPDTIEVLGCGAFQNCTSLTSVYLPRQVATGQYAGENAYPGPFNGSGLRDVTFGSGWTSIPDALFQNCTALQSVVIPDTVTYIGWKAFQSCKSMKSLTLPANLENLRNLSFENCSSLTSVVLPESMKEIGCGAFRNCTSLESVHIPAQMTTQMHTGSNYQFPGPFANCAALRTVTFSPGRTEIPQGLFLNCGLQSFTFPAGIKKVQWLAFGSCKNLEQVTFCEGMEIVGDSAFKDCVALKNLALPEGLLRIEQAGFQGCNALTALTLPNSLQYIGFGAFQYCNGLTSVYIPAEMRTDTYTGYSTSYPGPFYGCEALTDVTFAPDCAKVTYGLFFGCFGLRKLVLPEHITTINNYAFRYCKNMTEVVFHENLKVIEQEAFWDCDALQTVTLPDGIRLGYGVFLHCEKLTSVNLPANLTTTGGSGMYSSTKGPFYACSFLTEVDFDESTTVIPEGLFADCDGLKQVVVPESVTEVQARAFSNCANLQQVYFRGDGPVVTAVGESRRSFPSYVTLYAMQHRTGWTDSTAYDQDAKTWNGYKLEAWNGVIPQIDSLNVPEGKYCFLVVDEDGNPISGVNVSWDEPTWSDAETAVTDEDGIALFDLGSYGLPVVTVEKDGYLTWTNEDSNWEKSEYRYDIVVLYPEGIGQMKLQSARFSLDGEKWPVNVLVETKKRTLGSDADLTWDFGSPAFQLSCRAFAPELVVRYELWQDLIMVAESTDGKFTKLSNDSFQEGGNCFVRVVSTDGNMVDTAINLEFVKAEINQETSINLASDKFSFEVGDNVPFVGGSTVEIDLPLYCPVNAVMTTDGKIQFGLNVNLLGSDSEEERLQEVKQFVSDSRNLKESFKAKDLAKFKSLVKEPKPVKWFQNGEVNFIGYAELDPGSATASGCIMLEAKIDAFTWNYNTVVPVSVIIVPVTVQVKLEAELITTGKISYDWANATLLGTVDMNPSVKFTAFGGIGASGIAGLGVYGSAKLENEFRLIGSPKGLRTVDLTGELGIKVYLAMLSAEKPFAYNTWHLYSASGIQAASLYNVSNKAAVSLFEASNYELEDLSYLAEESSWMGAMPQMARFSRSTTTLTSLLEDTYRNAQPVMVSDGETIYASFLRADALTNSVYAVVTRFDGETWSEPVRLNSEAVLDNAPSLCIAEDGTVWLAYAETAEGYDGLSLLNYAQNQRIVVGKVNPETLAFTECNVYAADGYARLQQLAVVDGVPTLVWVDSNVTDENSVLFPDGGEICFAQWSNGAWSDAEVLSAMAQPILSVTAGAADGKLAVACLVDTDGSGETSVDRTLYEVTAAGTQTLKEGTIGKVTYAAMPGAQMPCFLWNEGGFLCGADGTSVEVAGITDVFAVVDDRIYYSTANDTGADLVFVQHADDVWSLPIQATSGGRYLEDLNVVSMGGEDYVLGMHTDAAIEQDSITDRKNLVWSRVLPINDLRLDEVQYDASALTVGEPVELTLTVTNAGENAVDSIAVSVDGQPVSTQNCELQPGQTLELTAQITCPAALTTFGVAVGETDVRDYTPDNNIADVAVGYADVAVALVRQAIGTKQQLMAYVTNEGIDTASGMLQFFDDNGLPAGEQAFADLKRGETTVVTLALTDEFLGTGDMDVMARILCDGEELYTYNNTTTIHIAKIPFSTKILSAERTDGKITAEISCSGEIRGTAVIAAYSGQGRMEEIYLYPLQAGLNTVKQTLADPALTDVRVFVLDENNLPQCKAETVK